MKGDYYMRQCLIEWDGTKLQEYAWLPEELAVEGKRIVAKMVTENTDPSAYAAEMALR